MIDINQLTAQKLIDNQYREVFPEFFQLQQVVENGIWHTHQNVFEHAVLVYQNVESDLTAIHADLANPINQYLETQIGKHTREEILRIATLLHDIAKTQTLITAANGQANCPGHEHLAAGQVKDFAERFDLDKESQSYVERIVLHHGSISEILFQVITTPNKTEWFWEALVKTVSDVNYELLLFIKADLNACHLRVNAPEEYQQRQTLILKWLKEKVPKI